MEVKFYYFLAASVFIMAVLIGLSQTQIFVWFWNVISIILLIVTFAYLLWKLFLFAKNLFYKK